MQRFRRQLDAREARQMALMARHWIGVQDRLQENIDILGFELSPAHMAALDALNDDHHYCWNPSQIL